MSRLTDEELARINGTRWQHVREVATPGMVVAMAIELRDRRAADLKPEEVEALEFAYDRIQCLGMSFGDRKWREMFPRMLATISRVIAEGARCIATHSNGGDS